MARLAAPTALGGQRGASDVVHLVKLDRCIASGVNYKCDYVGVHGFAADEECSMGSMAWMQVRYSPVCRHAKPLSQGRCQRKVAKESDAQGARDGLVARSSSSLRYNRFVQPTHAVEKLLEVFEVASWLTLQHTRMQRLRARSAQLSTNRQRDALNRWRRNSDFRIYRIGYEICV